MKKNNKLFKTGSNRSYAVVIPPDLIESLGWRDRQRLIIKKINGAIVIRDAKTRHKNPKH